MKSVVLAAVAMLVVAGCSSGDGEAASSPAPAETSTSAAPSPTMSEKVQDTVVAGQYISQADYEADPAQFADSDVVYFFHATWCPDCQATDDSLQETGAPDGVTIVKVDYDTANELRKEYGVTQQHTFVQVDTGGEQLAKWTGTFTADDIAAQVT